MSINVITLEGNNKTPYVEFNLEEGTVAISGRIIPENPLEFFDKLDSLLNRSINSAHPLQTIDISLDYFNSVSSKGFLLFLRKIIANSSSVTINWRYQKDDVEIREAGEDYAYILQHPFNFVETPA